MPRLRLPPRWRQSRKHKSLRKFSLPSDPFQRLAIINPLSFPFPALQPILVKRRHFEFIKVIRRRRRVDRCYKSSDVAMNARCIFLMRCGKKKITWEDHQEMNRRKSGQRLRPSSKASREAALSNVTSDNSHPPLGTSGGVETQRVSISF